MIETLEQYEEWIRLRDPGKGARRGHYDYQAYLTIEALRKVARASKHLAALGYNKANVDWRQETLDALADLSDWLIEEDSQ